MLSACPQGTQRPFYPRLQGRLSWSSLYASCPRSRGSSSGERTALSPRASLFFLEPSESLRLSHGLRREPPSQPPPSPGAFLIAAPARAPAPDPDRVSSANRPAVCSIKLA